MYRPALGTGYTLPLITNNMLDEIPPQVGSVDISWEIVTAESGPIGEGELHSCAITGGYFVKCHKFCLVSEKEGLMLERYFTVMSRERWKEEHTIT